MGYPSPECRSCSLHNIDYPPHVLRCMVNGCDNYLIKCFRDHDEEWREKLEHYNKLYERQTEPEPEIILPDVLFNVAEYGGQLWIPHDELLKAGYLNIEDFQVVKIRGRFYELQAHIGRTLTHGIKGGAWWVEEIDPDNFEVPDYIPEGGDTDGSKDAA